MDDGVWCSACDRHHQPRERLVPCLTCRRDTDDPHAKCVSCRIRDGEEFAPFIAEDRPPVDRPVAQVGRDHPDTAKRAAGAALPRSGSDRRRVLDHVRLCGERGATDDELEIALGLPHQTVSARTNGLRADGWIRDSGLRRNTRSGAPAAAWITQEAADARPEGTHDEQRLL